MNAPRKMTICVKWKEPNGLSAARVVDTEEEATALASEKNGEIERWPTITSGTVHIYGIER